MALRDFSKEKLDIIVLAGQSNGEGLGYGDASRPYKPSDRVWQLNPDFTIQMAQERVNMNCVQGNLALSFARAYLEERLAEDRSLLILPAAVNGTGFADERWIPTGDLYLRMMEMIRTVLDLNPENRLVAFLWHQGETEVFAEESYEFHRGHLSALLGSVREGFGVPELPIVAGDFCQEFKAKYPAACVPIVQAIRDVCREFGGAFVETQGLISNWRANAFHPQKRADVVHFCRESLYELGQRYYDAFVELTKE